MTKIAHISDTHINRLKYHKEYKEVFDDIYETLIDEKVDLIVHTGDIFHSKLELTPECTKVAYDFLTQLANIAPLHIIPGNHDVNMNNKERLDAITPVARAVKATGKDIYYYRNSSVYNIQGHDNIVFKVFSMLDETNWRNIVLSQEESRKIIIGLYHGCLKGSKTDLGHELDGEHGMDIFQGCDYGFLGDIHKSNQIMDSNGRFRYVGSTIQQNHGETDDKGILIWNIRSKTDYDCKHIVFPNPSPFVTIKLDEEGNIPKKLEVHDNAKLRVILEHAIPLDKLDKSMKKIKEKFHSQSITFVNNSKAVNKEVAKNFTDKDNVRNLKVQEKYIREFLEEYNAPEDTVKKVLSLNERFSVTSEPDIQRNVNWHLKSMKWNNMFNYHEDNSINFDNLNGVVGIFGPNYSGKSSVIDCLLYSLFNTTTKNVRKNLNLVNNDRMNADVELKVSIDNDEFTIHRKIEKSKKKSKGQMVTESRTTVDFTSSGDKLNGVDRSDTDKSIRNILGTYDDFLLTSVSSQFGSLSFINDGSTTRKEILTNFLDLNFFNEKLEQAKEESASLKALIKKQEKIDYAAAIEEHSKDAKARTGLLAVKQAEVDTLKKTLESLIEEKTLLDNKIKEKLKSLPNSSYDKLQEKFNILVRQIPLVEKEIKVLEDSINESNNLISKHNTTVSEIDIEELRKNKDIYSSVKNEVILTLSEIKNVTNELNNLNSKLGLLKEVPCGDQFKQCKFIKDAHNANIELVPLNSKLDRLSTKKVDKEAILDSVGDIDIINNKIHIYQNAVQSQSHLSTKLNTQLSKLSDLKTKLVSDTNDLTTLKKELEQFTNIDEIEEDKRQLNILINKIQVCRVDITNIEAHNSRMTGVIATSIEKSNALDAVRKEYEKNVEEYSAFDLYIKAMHPSGVPFEIVKKHLPIINGEIEKILSGFAEFNVYMEAESDKLELFIEHPEQQPRPIELGSGAEKMMASIAIRLALVNVCSLPKCDAIFLDEPATAMDAKNLEMFSKVLDLLKTQFRTVFLITHLEQLKDSVDFQILLDRNEQGIAHISI